MVGGNLRRTHQVLGRPSCWSIHAPIFSFRSQSSPYNREHRYCSSRNQDHGNNDTAENGHRRQRRVWKAAVDATTNESKSSSSRKSETSIQYWTDRIIDRPDGGKECIEELVNKVRDNEGGTTANPSEQANNSTGGNISSSSSNSSGGGGDGRMRQRQLGVLHADPATDMQMLINNYTVKAVASALRDREDALQQAAVLSADGRIEELQTFLTIFHPKYVLERRRLQKQTKSFMRYDNDGLRPSIGATTPSNKSETVMAPPVLDDPISSLHTDAARQVLRKMLMRMPRTITTAYTKRAAVCLALCLSDGVPSILLEKRAPHLRSHPDEVCLPGGMVCDIQDQTIVSTSIREMKEEIGGLGDVNNNTNDTTNAGTPIEIIGILRLNWGEVHHLTGIAVTPVVCYLGELPDQLHPNPSEVAEIFTIPLSDLLDTSLWVHKEGFAPIFVGGPHVIWGLTGYILERLATELGRLSAT